jgi:hypothetical protein
MYTSKQEIFPGMWKYSNVFTEDLDLVNRIEYETSQGNVFWERASVGLDAVENSYRFCSVLKMDEFGESHPLYKDIYQVQKECVDDYNYMHNLDINFWEWTNIVKYVPNEYFNEHSDHGWSYVSTVSLVGYPNDDYTGGSLYFPKLNLNVVPEAGDLLIFPSSYLFSHVAMPVITGTKYCFATMLDYNDDAHSREYDEYIVRKYNNEKRAYNVT